MTNETGRVLKEFNSSYVEMLQNVFGTEELDLEQVQSTVKELELIELAKKEKRWDDTRDFTP